jgi:Helix-turn-helix
MAVNRTQALAAVADKLPSVFTGRQLRAARALAGLSRKALADMAGISPVTIEANKCAHTGRRRRRTLKTHIDRLRRRDSAAPPRLLTKRSQSSCVLSGMAV